MLVNSQKCIDRKMPIKRTAGYKFIPFWLIQTKYCGVDSTLQSILSVNHNNYCKSFLVFITKIPRKQIQETKFYIEIYLLSVVLNVSFYRYYEVKNIPFFIKINNLIFRNNCHCDSIFTTGKNNGNDGKTGEWHVVCWHYERASRSGSYIINYGIWLCHFDKFS